MRSRQPSLSLDSPAHWDPDAETSEEFKEDQIIAAQHRGLIEERILNGLRMPSPPPISSKGRIAGLGIGCRRPNPESQQRTLSPLAAPLVPDIITENHRIRCHSRPVCTSSEARSCHIQSTDDQSSGPQSEERDKRLNPHEDPLENNTFSELESDLQQISEFPAGGQYDYADEPRSRATRGDSGKGKERELSHSPERSQLPSLLKRTFIKRFFDAHKSHLWPAIIDSDDLSFDADTGQDVVNIPWPRRDPEQERINDSKIIEIHLGETSDDECEVRERFGKMCIDDLDLEKVLAARRENGVDFYDENALDDEDLRDILRGGDVGASDWREHLRDNERVASCFWGGFEGKEPQPTILVNGLLPCRLVVGRRIGWQSWACLEFRVVIGRTAENDICWNFP